jgi:DNA-binding response OmpR family regulator
MDELRARVRALGRRRLEDRTPQIEIGDLLLDPATLGVWRAGRAIRLTAREFALLELLARHPGQIFARDRLIDALWDADFAAESNIVEVYIRSIRRKVDEGRRDGLIEVQRLQTLFEEIQPQLLRYPAIDPAEFRAAVTDFCNC